MYLRVASLPLFVIAAVLALPARAQVQADTVSAAGEDVGPSVIVVTAQRDNASVVLNSGDAGALGDKSAEDLPFTLRSYDETLILNQQPLTLGEVLDNDPTVRTTYGFGNAAEQFVIRGFTLFGDDLGLNGLYGIAPRQLVAPELFGSVQVLNGANAFLNGAAPGGSGVGGNVNLQLKRAEEPLTRATVGYIGDAHLGGSFDVARRFGADREWGVRVNGAFRDGEVAIAREDRRTMVLGGSFDYDGGAFRAALDLAYQEVRIDSLRPKVTVASGAVPRVPEADANYAQDFTFSDLKDVFGTLSLEYDLADNALLYARAGARDGREDGVYGSITVLDAATGAATGGALLVPRTDNNEALEAGLRVSLGRAVTHEINFGGNLNWQVNRNAFDFLGGFAGYATNLYDAPQVALPPTGFVGGDLDDPFPILESRFASVFASDTIGLLDDRILLTGGLRLQTIRQKTFNYYNGGALDQTYAEDAVTPVAGVVVKPVSELSLFANRIEALQPGEIAPVNAFVGGAFVPVANAGAALAPYRSVQYEAGGKLRLGLLFASLAFYQIEQPFSILAADPAAPDRLLFTTGGEQRNRGVELTVNGTLAPGLRLIAGAAYTDAKLVATEGGAFDSRRAPGVPEIAANANVEWDLPFVPGLTLTGRVTHTGEQKVDAANTLGIDGWTVFDLGARYVFAAGETPVTLRFTVDNVTDEAYWASAFDVFSPALLQGQPRTLRASISADF